MLDLIPKTHVCDSDLTSPTSPHLPHLTYLTSPTSPHLPHLTYLTSPTSPHLPHLTYLTSPTSPHLPHLTYLTSPTSPTSPHLLPGDWTGYVQYVALLKLERLTNCRPKQRELRPEGLERWVVNLTDRALTPTQEEVLKLGLNFAPAPSKLPLTDTMAAVESGARRLSLEDADDLRGRVCGILR